MEGFTLTLPEAIAIIGSVVVIVTGIFGYMLKINTNKTNGTNLPKPAPKSYLETQVQGAHDRISEIKDRVTHVEGEVKLTVEKIAALRAAMKDHQTRDDQDHDIFDKKLDKMMDILIKILTDDKM